MSEMNLPLIQKIPIDCFRHSPCIDLAYTEMGTGEALVLIHGLGGNAWSWRRQLEALSHDYRVIALDLRGHGQSGYRDEEAVSIRTLAADVVALVRWLGIDQAHFCGHSLGGMIALEILVRTASLMKSLVLAIPWSRNTAAITASIAPARLACLLCPPLVFSPLPR